MQKPVDTVLAPESVVQLGRVEIRVREEASKSFASLPPCAPVFLIGQDVEILVNGEPVDLGGLHCKATIEIAPNEAVKIKYEAIATP